MLSFAKPPRSLPSKLCFSSSSRRESSVQKNGNRVDLGPDFIPEENTVIFGRGKACASSPGNRKLQRIIKGLASSYENASIKDQKSCLVSTVVSLIQQHGSFVKYEECTWWQVDDMYSREKVGYLFRYENLRNKRKANKDRTEQERKTQTSFPVSCQSSDTEPSPMLGSLTESVFSLPQLRIQSISHRAFPALLSSSPKNIPRTMTMDLTESCEQAVRMTATSERSSPTEHLARPSSQSMMWSFQDSTPLCYQSIQSRVSMDKTIATTHSQIEGGHDRYWQHSHVNEDNDCESIVTIAGGYLGFGFPDIPNELCDDLSGIFD